jgi:hypothetical protein
VDQPSLENPRAKLDRADEHLADLQIEADAYREREPYSVATEFHPDGFVIARLRLREPPPLRLGLILGDALSNWRSAFDNLAYQLILLGGRTPGKRETIGFPIFDKPRSFEAVGRKRIRGIRDDHADIIESLQPYPGRQGPQIGALSLLNAYVNADKHRAIHPTLMVFANAEAFARSFRREPVEAEFKLAIDPVGYGRPFEDGMELARIYFLDSVPDPPVQIQAHFPVEIAFGEDRLRLKALPSIRHHLRAIVRRFESDFP